MYHCSRICCIPDLLCITAQIALRIYYIDKNKEVEDAEFRELRLSLNSPIICITTQIVLVIFVILLIYCH